MAAMPPRPLQLTDKSDDAKRSPLDDIIYKQALEKFMQEPQARELGSLRDNYAQREKPLDSIKAHMRDLTDAEWAQMSREMRGNLRIRLCNDEVINALLRAWAQL